MRKRKVDPAEGRERTPVQSGLTGRELIVHVPIILPGLNQMLDARNRRIHRGSKMTSSYHIEKRDIETAISVAIRKAVEKKRRVRSWPGPFEGRVTISCMWLELSRRRDPDNIAAGLKFVLDSLVDCNVLQGDTHREIHSIKHDFALGSKEFHGSIVILSEVNEEAER